MARHRGMQAPINSIKHYVHRTNVGVATGALQSNIISESVVAPATANAFSVKEGAIIKAVYVELWLIHVGAASTVSQVAIILEKKPGNGTDMTAAQALNLGAYPNKKNIFYVSQGLLTSREVGGPIPLIRQWILIPKGKQRQGLDDQIILHVAPVGATANVCGIFTYKEYN